MIKETRRTILRPHLAKDLQRMNKYSNDPYLLYYDDDDPLDREEQDLEYTEAWLDFVMEEDDTSILRFGIEDRESSELIGFATLSSIDSYNRRAKVGLSIGEEDYRNKGYGREVLQALIDVAFSDLGLHRLEAQIFDFNLPSIRLFESLGFQAEGRLRDYALKPEGWVDLLQYACFH